MNSSLLWRNFQALPTFCYVMSCTETLNTEQFKLTFEFNLYRNLHPSTGLVPVLGLSGELCAAVARSGRPGP